MNKSALSTLAGLATIALGASSAVARADISLHPISLRCLTQTCVYDAQGTLVGYIDGNTGNYTQVIRQVGAGSYELLATRHDGIDTGDFALFYDTANCTGQAYIVDYGLVVQPGEYTGHAIYSTAVGSVPKTFYWLSYLYTDISSHQQACQTGWVSVCADNKCQNVGGEAILVESHTFVPPFSLK